MHIETCDICKKQFVAGYGYSLMTSWVVTGHAYVGGFSCEDESTKGRGQQHWGCTPEHAMQAAMACLASHMSIETLQAKQQAQRDKGNTRYSPQDATWAAQGGENFHIVTLEIGAASQK